MINEIMEAIGYALNKRFGEAYKIHMKESGVDVEKPCFFISCVNLTNKRFLGKRYFQTNQFCIRYFPKILEGERECHEVAEEMYQCLEYIIPEGDDKPMRGTGMAYEITDGILNFFVNYDLFVYKKDVFDEMEKMSADVTVKG